MSLGASSFTNGPKVARPRSVPASAIKRKAPKQVAVSRTIVSKPNTADQVERLCKEAYEHALQVTAADIVSFDFWRDPVAEDGPVFHFYEVYESEKAWSDFYGTEAMKTFLTKLEPLAAEDIGVTLYEIRDGRIGAASIAAGPKGEGGLEDATGAGGAGGAGYQQTSKVLVGSNLLAESEEGEKKKESSIWMGIQKWMGLQK